MPAVHARLPPALLLLVAACSAPGEDTGPPHAGSAGDASLPDATPPADVGAPVAYDVYADRFPVGVVTVELVDPERDRSLTTEVWYPAAPEAADLPLERPVGTSTPAHRDAPPATEAGPFPLLVFSHGNQGIRIQSTFHTVRLAARGYVVVAPDHTGNTMGGRDPAEVAAGHRPADVAFVAAESVRLSDGGEGPLAGLIDGSRAGLTGHSFGAWTALAVPLLHEGFLAAVALAPPGPDHVEPPRPLGGLDVPVLIVAGTRDGTTPYAEAQQVFDQVAGPRYLAAIDGAGHFSFTDLCGLWASDYVQGDGCDGTFTPPARVHEAANRLAVPFFDRYMKGEAAAGRALTAQRVNEDLGEGVEYRAEPLR